MISSQLVERESDEILVFPLPELLYISNQKNICSMYKQSVCVNKITQEKLVAWWKKYYSAWKATFNFNQRKWLRFIIANNKVSTGRKMKNILRTKFIHSQAMTNTQLRRKQMRSFASVRYIISRELLLGLMLKIKLIHAELKAKAHVSF